MKIQKSFNQEGREQIIKSDDKIVKIDGKYLEVRLIQTRAWAGRDHEGKVRNIREFTKPMPRARFVKPTNENIHYLVSREDFLKLQGGQK